MIVIHTESKSPSKYSSKSDFLIKLFQPASFVGSFDFSSFSKVNNFVPGLNLRLKFSFFFFYPLKCLFPFGWIIKKLNSVFKIFLFFEIKIIPNCFFEDEICNCQS